MKLIPLTRGLHAMVDDEDYDELMKYKWYALWPPNARSAYARRRASGGSYISMSTHLTGPGRTRHRDGNSLNHQRENLSKALGRPLRKGEPKRCPQCEQEKPQSEFSRNASTSDGLQHHCRPCAKEVSDESRRRNPRPLIHELPPQKLAAIRKKRRERYDAGARAAKRESNLRNNYGITYEEKRAMFEAQEGRCGSCFAPLRPMGVEGTKEPSIDHSHVTGKVRSLLDDACNTSDGRLGRDFRNTFALGMYQLNDGPYYGPITVTSDLGTWTSAVGTIDGGIGRAWKFVPRG